MFKTQYIEVGRVLYPQQEKLIHRLWQAADSCSSLELASPTRLHNLIQTIADAYFSFLQNWQQNAPDHLGEILNHNRATPMFLSAVNKAFREFCVTYLDDTLLVAGLEATADFCQFTMQAYIQTNQGLVATGILSRQEREKLRATLTDREVITLQNLAKGLTNKQIAKAVGVSERMIANYLKQARQKLGTKSRSDTIIAAIRLIEE